MTVTLEEKEEKEKRRLDFYYETSCLGGLGYVIWGQRAQFLICLLTKDMTEMQIKHSSSPNLHPLVIELHYKYMQCHCH